MALAVLRIEDGLITEIVTFAPLPAPGHATPMTYQIGGKQYVVIAAGGHAKIEEESLSDALIAFALP